MGGFFRVEVDGVRYAIAVAGQLRRGVGEGWRRFQRHAVADAGQAALGFFVN